MKLTHEFLVKQGGKWLKAHGYPIVKVESHSNRLEHPDIIGFNASHSAVIEVKTSKADFFRDFDKPCRQPWFTGLGNYRFFLVPESLYTELEIDPDSKWHYLLARDDGSIYSTEIHPNSNQIPWNWERLGSDMAMERAILYTLVRNSRN